MAKEVLISRGKLLTKLYEKCRDGHKLSFAELVVIIGQMPAEIKEEWKLP